MAESFLQTKEWLDFQTSLGRKTWHIAEGNFRANIIRHDLPFGKCYLYIPHGPEIDLGAIKSGLSDEVRSFVGQIRQLGKKEKAIFIKMEPLHDVVTELLHNAKIKFKKSKDKHLQPSKTVVINLELSEEELLSRMHHKTRYNINLASKKGLKLVTYGDTESRSMSSDDIGTGIKSFWKLLKKTAKQDKFYTHELAYYQKLLGFFKGDDKIFSKLYLVELEGRPIAGAVILAYAGTVYYLHGAMDRDYRSTMAPYFMHWEIAKMIKANGYKKYDLWGIDPVKWPGVTRFKMGFNGELIERPGSFDLTLSWFWHLLYKIARRIF